MDATNLTKTYTNGEVTVIWQNGICIHSALCFKGLPQVFDPKKRPWINPAGANTSEIIEQVKKCPSGALTYFKNESENGGNGDKGK